MIVKRSALDDVRQTILAHSTPDNPIKELTYSLEDFKKIYQEIEEAMKATDWKVPIVPDPDEVSVFYMGVKIKLKKGDEV